MAHHDLKCRQDYYVEVIAGRKTFEVRRDDRAFAVGDTVRLHEVIWASCDCGKTIVVSTGRSSQLFEIASKVDGGEFGIAHGYCVIGLFTTCLFP